MRVLRLLRSKYLQKLCTCSCYLLTLLSTLLLSVLLSIVFPFLQAAHAEKIRVSQDLEVESANGLTIIHTSHETTPISELVTSPPRLVIDLPSIAVSKSSKLEFRGNPYYVAIRVGRHSEHTRLVFDLKKDDGIIPKMSVDGLSIFIDFGSSSEIRPTATPASLPTILPGTPAPQESPRAESVNEIGNDVIRPELKFSINKLVATFQYGSRPVVDVIVKNQSANSLFMTTSSEAVLNPGTLDESKITTTSLIASPRRFELGVNQERVVRLVLTKPSRDHDDVFRVNFVPDAIPFENQTGRRASRVVTGISMLVVAVPENPQPQLKWTWNIDGLTLENIGNSNFLLENGRICAQEHCTSLPVQRLYSGNEWQITGRDLDSAEFFQKIGDDFQKVSIRRKD